VPTPIMTYQAEADALSRALTVKERGGTYDQARREGLLSLLTSRVIHEAELFLKVNFPGIMQAWVAELNTARVVADLTLTDDELIEVLDEAAVVLIDWFRDRLDTIRQTIVDEREELLGPPPSKEDTR
jgi:hypothetical protein